MTMKNELHYHTNTTLRVGTITAGSIVAIALTASYIYASSADASTLTLVLFFNAFLFGGATVWFVTNAFRWLQERMSPPINHYAFAVISALTIGLGAWIIDDVVIDPPSGTADIVQQVVFALLLFAAGIIAAVSAAQRPARVKAVSPKSFVTGVSAESDDTLTWSEHSARWTAILGGLALAVIQSLLVSPTAVPVAIASTCFIRWASTTIWLRRARLQAIVGSTLIVILIHFLLADQYSEDGIGFVFIPSAALFAAAGLFGLLALALQRKQ